MISLVRTTSFRWSLAIALWSTVVSLVLFAFVYWRTAALELEENDAAVLEQLAYAAAEPDRTASRIESWVGVNRSERFAGYFAADGSRLAGNLGVLPAALARDGTVHTPGLPIPVAGGPPREDLRLAAFKQADGRVVVVAISSEDVERAKTTMLRALGLALGPMAALSVIGGIVLAARARRKLVATEGAVAAVMRGDLGRRLPVGTRRDEFDRLAANVNAMLDRIEVLVDEVRSVGDAIAHDLRTPLTRLRTRLERSRSEARSVAELQQAIDRGLAWLDQCLTMITAILRIGEIEHGRRRAGFAEVDLARTVAEVAEVYEPLADEKRVRIEWAVEAGLPRIVGDRDLLFEAAANLVDNAVKFTPAGGTIRLSLSRRDEAVVLSVEDSGPGIPEAERDRIFRRFYRAEPARRSLGNGLGLSLVAAVVKLHDFDISVGDASPQGSRFTIVCRNLAPARDTLKTRPSSAKETTALQSGLGRTVGPAKVAET